MAQELLSALTVGGGSAWPGGVGGGSQRSQISLPSRPECTKRSVSRLHSLIDLKIAKNPVFYFEVLIKIYSEEVF